MMTLQDTRPSKAHVITLADSRVRTADFPDLARLSASQLLEGFRSKRLSPVDVVEQIHDHLESHNPTLNAFVVYDFEQALQSARQSEKRWAAGQPQGVLDGILVSLKDLLLVSGWPTLKGSLTTDVDRLWDEDCPAATQLKRQGAIILGKTTTSEFGWAPFGESPQSGVTRSPWDLSRTPGGSSSGAAVATSMGFGPVHISTDGGGSTRLPAAFSGLFGVKPTFGRVAGYPSAHSGSMFHVGCMARTVSDAVLMLNAISDRDARDWNALSPASHLELSSAPDLKGLRIAYSPTLGYVDVDEEVVALVAQAAHRFETLGATVERVDPGFEDPFETRQTLLDAAVAKLIGDIPQHKHALVEPGLIAIARRGRLISAEDYLRAWDRREALGRHMSLFHKKWDILLTPTTPCTAGLTSEFSTDGAPEISPTGFLYPFNMTQQPAVSIPVGFTSSGMPVGAQLVGAKFNEQTLVTAALHYERLSPFVPLWSAPPLKTTIPARPRQG